MLVRASHLRRVRPGAISRLALARFSTENASTSTTPSPDNTTSDSKAPRVYKQRKRIETLANVNKKMWDAAFAAKRKLYKIEVAEDERLRKLADERRFQAHQKLHEEAMQRKAKKREETKIRLAKEAAELQAKREAAAAIAAQKRAQADLKRQAIHAHQVAYLAHEQQYWLKPEDINESIFERERRPVGWFPPKPKEDVPSR